MYILDSGLLCWRLFLFLLHTRAKIIAWCHSICFSILPARSNRINWHPAQMLSYLLDYPQKVRSCVITGPGKSAQESSGDQAGLTGAKHGDFILFLASGIRERVSSINVFVTDRPKQAQTKSRPFNRRPDFSSYPHYLTLLSPSSKSLVHALKTTSDRKNRMNRTQPSSALTVQPHKHKHEPRPRSYHELQPCPRVFVSTTLSLMHTTE